MVSNKKIAARALCVVTIYAILFVILNTHTGCKTVKNTNVYVIAHGSNVSVEATTRGSEPRDIFNGNDAAVKWK